MGVIRAAARPCRKTNRTRAIRVDWLVPECHDARLSRKTGSVVFAGEGGAPYAEQLKGKASPARIGHALSPISGTYRTRLGALGWGGVDGSQFFDRKDLERLLLDAVAHERRVQWCRTAATTIGDLGCAVWMIGWVERDDRPSALGTVLQTAAELAQGTVTLLEGSSHYAAAALVRQLVECEYLAWLFGEDPEEAARWSRSEPADRQRLRPAAMRKRSQGRFRSEEYASHCERGGHPHPAGAFMLPGREDSRQLAGGRWQWVDLGQHLERLWDLALVAMRSHDLTAALSYERTQRVEDARGEWHARDQLAVRAARLAVVDGRRVIELAQPG